MVSRGNRVVIIGAGSGAVLVAKKLLSTACVTLIDPEDFFENSWRHVRAVVEPSFPVRRVVPQTGYFTDEKLVKSHVASITKTEVLTKDGEHVPYDYLVVAMELKGAGLKGSWQHETVLATSLDNQGHLMVDEYLRVIDQKNIFAVGDITDVPEIKKGDSRRKHAKVVAKNINLLMRGDGGKMINYKLPRGCIGQFMFMTVRGWLKGKMNFKDCLLG